MGSNGTDCVFCPELGDEWSEEEYEDLMLCLREDGASVECIMLCGSLESDARLCGKVS